MSEDVLDCTLAKVDNEQIMWWTVEELNLVDGAIVIKFVDPQIEVRLSPDVVKAVGVAYERWCAENWG